MKKMLINMNFAGKILTGIVFVTVMAFGQSFYSNVLLSPNPYFTAKAVSLGGSTLADEGHPFSVVSNPAVGAGMKGLHLALTGNGLHLRERRSFPVQDSFGDFLADNDYVHNRYWATTAGFAFGYGGSNWTAMAAYTPVSDLRYTYEEEVRSSTYDYNRDPLVGYHQIKFQGIVGGISGGLTYSPIKQLSLGLSGTMLNGRNIERGVGVTVIDLPDIRLASDTTTFEWLSSELAGGLDMRFGVVFHAGARHTFHAAYIIAGDVELENPGVIAMMDTTLVMPEWVVDKDVIKQKTNRPAALSLGFRYIPENILKTELFAQADLTMWSQFKSEYFGSDTALFDPNWKNTWTVRAGVEHIFSSGVPMRAGWTYSKSPVRNELNRSEISFGTGYQIEALSLDLNVSWYETIYRYNDLFPIEGEVRISRDKVREAGVRVMSTLTYSF